MQCPNCSKEMYDYTFCPECGECRRDKLIPDLFGELREAGEFLDDTEEKEDEDEKRSSL